MDIAASKVPARKGMPWPMSDRKRSPSTSLSSACDSMEDDMSRPIHSCGPPAEDSIVDSIWPERPEPQPMSRIRDGEERAKSSRARYVMLAWMDRIRDEVVYLRDSVSL